MTVTKSDFDPTILGQYELPPSLLHFQWKGKRSGTTVYRYILAETIDPNKIDSRTKVKEGEEGMTQDEVWDRVVKDL